MTRTERVEQVVLVLILLGVGVAAAVVSFSHVAAWTLSNSPSGTPEAYGYVNAAVSELIPIAALLVVRQRRRKGQPIGYPLFLVFAASALSLAAQLAVAQPSPAGWLLSSVPSLAFMALTKLVLSGSGHRPSTAGVPESDVAASAIVAPEVAEVQGELSPVEEQPAIEPPTRPRKRRPTAETRRLAEAALAEDPTLTRDQLAALLGISTRRVRVVMATA